MTVLKTSHRIYVGMGNFTGKRLDNSSFEGKNEIMENDWVCWLECQSSLGAMPAPQMAVDRQLGQCSVALAAD